MADPSQAGSCWQLDTLSDCRLAIGRYPVFRYNATGGSATTSRTDSPTESPTAAQSTPLHFAAEQICIPSLNWQTTRFLGLPLPPGLQINIQPQLLQGGLDPADGSMVLCFKARFQFQVIAGKRLLYQAPDLHVATQLSTERVQGRRHVAQGKALDHSGEASLVGVATIPCSGEAWLDRFLGLPDEALAVLHCRLNRVA